MPESSQSKCCRFLPPSSPLLGPGPSFHSFLAPKAAPLKGLRRGVRRAHTKVAGEARLERTAGDGRVPRGPSRPQRPALPGREPSAGAAAADGGEEGACPLGSGCPGGSWGARGKRSLWSWGGIEAEVEEGGAGAESARRADPPKPAELVRSRWPGQDSSRGLRPTPGSASLGSGPEPAAAAALSRQGPSGS